MLTVRELSLPGVKEIIPDRIADERGFFSETYNCAALAAHGVELIFVQDNFSLSSRKGVLRGLHYQLPPRAQDKLVRVTKGAVFDVAVDIRRGSTTFGQWVGLEVSAEKWNQILVPRGFAHGFVTLTDDVEVQYKVTDGYSQPHDRSIRFDDPEIGIDWPKFQGGFVLSKKDQEAPRLSGADLF